MARFRKKPTVIEAVKFGGAEGWPLWLTNAIRRGDVWQQGGDQPYLTIATLEGEMRAEVGDWIILGVEGEIYPCKPSVFAATYEEVS